MLNTIGWKGTLGTAKTAEFNFPAKRSVYTKLDSSKVESVIGKKIFSRISRKKSNRRRFLSSENRAYRWINADEHR